MASILGIPGLSTGLQAISGLVAGTVAHGNVMGGLAQALGLSPAVADMIGMGMQKGSLTVPGVYGGGLAGTDFGGFSDTSGYGGHGGYGGGDAGMGADGSAGVGGGGVGAGQGGGPAGGNCCFVAGTKIAMEHNGVMNIEDVRPGHIVQSFNLRSKLFNTSIVRDVKTVMRADYYEVVFSSGNTLKVTDDHPMFTTNGWASIKPEVTGKNPLYDQLNEITTLTENSSVMNMNGHYEQIKSITRISGPIKTYTLGQVTPSRNFFANGYLASNYAC